eukprot:1160114-Pelagomonas_calceolata.AAC.19
MITQQCLLSDTIAKHPSILSLCAMARIATHTYMHVLPLILLVARAATLTNMHKAPLILPGGLFFWHILAAHSGIYWWPGWHSWHFWLAFWHLTHSGTYWWSGTRGPACSCAARGYMYCLYSPVTCREIFNHRQYTPAAMAPAAKQLHASSQTPPKAEGRPHLRAKHAPAQL